VELEAPGSTDAETVILAPAENKAELRSEGVTSTEGDESISLAVKPADSEAALAPAPTIVMAETAKEGVVGGESVEADAINAQPVGPLKAGEVDDNAQWDDYLLYRRQYQGLPVHDREVSERYIIEVKDGQGQPVLGATVRFWAGQEELYTAQTYANGQVLFHPLALNLSSEQIERFRVQVEKDNLSEELSLTRFKAQAATSFSERWTVTLDTRAQTDSTNLDVLFLIDATGSMADEIAKIQETIFDVSARIDALPGQANVRYGMVTYRDRGDEYVTRAYEFTPNVADFSANLNTVVADGGGDTPESLNEALHQALHGVEWRGGDTIQLIFLIADAAPHLDYAQDYDYAVEMDQAAQRGIKIFPIASSGLDDQGEYIYRQLAQYTQGRFIFLTYAGPTNGGAPGEITTHHVEDYSVASLDDLLVKLVQAELAYQNPEMALP
jgi:Mg-chelatase subunit ChlD